VVALLLLLGLGSPRSFAGDGGPTPEHQQLGSFAGTWSFESRWRGADGKSHTRTGISENRWILGGRFLECDATGQGEGERVESRIVLGFDPRQQRYFAVLLDSLTSYFLQPTGTYRASTRSFVLSGKERDPGAGSAFSYRLLLRVEGPDRYVIEVYFDTPGPAPMRLIEAVYTRRAPSADAEGASR
jgi:hypothetical protein